ncbi:YcnI family copper-binding membrane protein [Nocardioides daeguensis]|uniref:YncI copper-binding domain-containing protein n=1 Tax=Nocardioides daeguensis TaxID=908359 RepID=A0ABP6WJB9_9ACTN|nr:YcnI family protein [Nocardioides daeguensis]MBV6729062.1 YcnI family protein [Nocardioides daeguensis]MCR1774934.1 YcnI family protein [Nocardioides daeguensis]
MQIRRFTLPTLGATAALGIVALSAGAASAHVDVAPDTTAAGSYAVLTFSVPHGCEGSPTTKVAIQMPADIPQVTPSVNPGWTVEKVSESLAEPLEDAHGNAITERISQVVYTARTPLQDGFRDTLALSVQLPEKVGETLTFPVLQTCAQGETAWNETPAEGQDEEELKNPAPALTTTEASAESHHGGAATASDEDSEEDSDEHADAKSEADDGDGNGLAIGGLVAGLGGLALGGLALARSGKSA